MASQGICGAKCQAAAEELPGFSSFSEAEKAEYWAALALRHCPGLGARSHAKLLKYFGSALTAFESVDNWEHCGIRRSCMEALKKGLWRQAAKKEWDAAGNARILLWTSSHYPPLLKEIPDAPILLYLRGKLCLLANPCVAIVGSRKASSESKKIAFSLARALSECGITIVSGMAIGIDESAHRGAISSVGGSVGVLGTGVNLCYPSENAELFSVMSKKGLLLSEFPPNAKPVPANFPVRNRIISGLSLGTIVVEAAIKSGSLITAQLACDQNREVFAVPGAAYNDRSMGCKNLIRQGAHPVFSHEDILHELFQLLRNFANFESVGQKASQTENTVPQTSCNAFSSAVTPAGIEPACQGSISGRPEEKQVIHPELPETVKKQAQNSESARILDCLKNGARHIEQLALETGLNMNELNSSLIMLELTGAIRRLPGACFECCR